LLHNPVQSIHQITGKLWTPPFRHINDITVLKMDLRGLESGLRVRRATNSKRKHILFHLCAQVFIELKQISYCNEQSRSK
jgi:hypothetical protein